MAKNAFSFWQAPPHWLQISSLDCHTGGEPLRIITGGFPKLRGLTVLEQRRDCQQRFDHLRTALMFEPRGHADMYGCIIVPPERANSAFGVLFIHNEGYSTMCGHAMIALAKTAVEAGVVPVTYPVTEFLLDAPCGQIRLFAEIATGNPTDHADQAIGSAAQQNPIQVHRCWFENVPSFVAGTSQYIDVAGIGRVPYQLAYGGAFYAYVDAQAIDLDLSMANHRQIIRYGALIKQQLLADKVSVQHPFSEDLSFLYGVIFTGPAQKPGVYQRNVCIFANGELDRSPTGSGVSGLVALLQQQGRLAPGEKIRIESIVGSEFEVSVKTQTSYGPYDAVIPQVAGTAHVTGQHQFFIDPEDPLAEGFIFR
ncbi:proline racemase family protein [Rheinheimera sp.]|uniref:proline racemase family protein n=1 Tax=Rheinheimera sp. TaxID=1869214 RepID=UPI0027BA4143|nr:proline racemase family protein [Rheinheimera sp.]